jgi:hypothetical protein
VEEDMSDLPLLFAAAAVLAACLGSIAVWAPRRLSMKLGAVLIAALFMPLAYAGISDLLSRPKPVDLEWWLAQADEATVVGSVPEEGRRIFLWLALDGVDEPRAYTLPWSRELAQQLQDAQEQAAEQQTAVRMRLPFERSLDDREPKFYALPQPALPEKPAPPPAMRFERPEADA